MKVRYLIIAFVLSLGIMGCSDSTNQNSGETTATETSTESSIDTPEEKVDEEDVAASPKHDKEFYRQLLEAWCCENYKACFGKGIRNPRNYLINSVIVETCTISYETEGGRCIADIKGKHSWKGSLNKHNDDPFVAKVTDLGDDKYEVFFEIEKWGLPGKISATRTIEYSE